MANARALTIQSGQRQQVADADYLIVGAGLRVSDDDSDALVIADDGGGGGDVYFKVDTTNVSPTITVGNETNSPTVQIQGGGMLCSPAATFNGGVTISSSGDLDFSAVNIDLDPTGDFTLDMDPTKKVTIAIADDLAEALLIQEGSNAYLSITTTNLGGEKIDLGNVTTDPGFNFLGTGAASFGGNVVLTNGGVRLDELSSAPGDVTDGGWVYTKDDSGDTELFYEDDGGQEVQLTKDGEIGPLSPAQSQSTSSSTTTSSTYEAMSGMSQTPGAGEYLVWFSCTIEVPNNQTVAISIFTGGTQQAHTERETRNRDAQSRRCTMATNAYVSVGALDSIAIQWKTTGDTATVYARTLNFLKVG